MGQKFFITEEEKIRIKSLYVESVETPEDQQLDKILAQAGVTLTPDEKMELSPECPMEEPPSQHAEIIDNIKSKIELMDLSNLDEVYNNTDIIQIGARNMSNFSLLAELGKTKKPIMLKRGMSAKATEWLLAADYILSGGNENVILCERGIRSFDIQSRNVFDLGVIPLMQSLSHLPVFADPSHGVGKAAFVNKMGLAAIAAGANGLMIEIHPHPEKALSDGEQALTFNEFETFLNAAKPLLSAINKSADFIETNNILKLQTLL